MKQLLLLACFAFSLTGYSQVINIENARLHTDTTGWAGDAAVSFSLASNNNRVWVADADAHLQYKTDKSLWLMMGHYGFLKGGGTSYVDNALAHLRYNYKFSKRLRWEVFTQLQDNVITQIKSRFLIGSGPRLKLAGHERFHCYLATALMYEYEQEKSTPFITHRDWRGSSYASFTFSASKQTELTGTLYYQPLLKNFSDYRLMQQFRLTVKAGKHTSLRVNWHYLYDRQPAVKAPRETYVFSTGLGYRF
jgi:hypothetical protein